MDICIELFFILKINACFDYSSLLMQWTLQLSLCLHRYTLIEEPLFCFLSRWFIWNQFSVIKLIVQIRLFSSSIVVVNFVSRFLMTLLHDQLQYLTSINSFRWASNQFDCKFSAYSEPQMQFRQLNSNEIAYFIL